jgi:exodeoxyribonuclease-3
MQIISWNVNGLRAILKKGFLELARSWAADLICLQETKTNADLPLGLPGYQEFWGHGVRPGYSGTLILARGELAVTRRALPDFLAAEGRGVWLELPAFHLLNIYFPNGGQGVTRLAYKMRYYDEFLTLIKKLDLGKPVIFGGDVNTAHQEIDLARPKENATHTGFLPQERAWLDQVAAGGLADVWRVCHPGEVGYSWWDYKTRARERNVGWRIDYFWASQGLLPKVETCQIMSQILGSDHAPLQLNLALS